MDSDDDIFIIKQIKPVNRQLTVKKAFEIKEKVLQRVSRDNSDDVSIILETTSSSAKKETVVQNKSISNDEILVIQQENTTTSASISIKSTSDVKGAGETSETLTNGPSEDNSILKKALTATETVTVTEIEAIVENKTKDSPEKVKTPDKNVESTVVNREKSVFSPETPPKKRKRSRSNSSTPSKKISEYFTPEKKSKNEENEKENLNGTSEKISPEKNSPKSSEKNPVAEAGNIPVLDVTEESPVIAAGDSITIEGAENIPEKIPIKAAEIIPAAVKTPITAAEKILIVESSEESPVIIAEKLPAPAEKFPATADKTPEKASVNGENSNIKLSPAIKKRPSKFNLILDENNLPSTSKSPKKKSPKIRKPKEPKPEATLTHSKYENSKLNCQLFAKIINDEISKQLSLEASTVGQGKPFEKPLSEEEFKIIESFFKLDPTCQQFFVRMYCRQHKWNRLSEIRYDDIGVSLTFEYNLLEKDHFFDTNIDEMDLAVQLELFKVGELNALCRNFNVACPTSSTKKKIIETIINDNKTQKSVMDMFKKTKKDTRMDVLKKEIKKTIGPCFRLNENVVRVFNRVVLLYSLVHSIQEHNKRVSETVYLLFREYVGEERYLKYNLSPTVIFQTREDFLMYEKALQDLYELEDAVVSKDFQAFDALAKAAKVEFEKILKDKEFIKRYLELPSFLKRYSAGSVYATMLSMFCEKFKQKRKGKEEKEDLIRVASLLVDQELFSVSKRGKWYEYLSQAFEASDRSDCAAKTLLVAKRDKMVNEVQILTLQLRGQAILKKIKNALKDEELREKLDDFSTIHSVQEPPSIEIKGKALEGKAGSKSIYVIENSSGKSYSSVEEQAIYYYKENEHFTQGMHVEGSVIQTIYFFLFFDIIYGASPPGVFQSPYQEAPLDFYSKSFYTNRKEEIESRLENLMLWSTSEILEKIKLIYEENFNIMCVVPWNDKMDPELYCEIIEIIGMDRLEQILRRLAENYRVVRSGFPDLTLWNPTTKRIKFVEVKSPNDRLSPNQRVWLNFLRTVGVDCEVCNVKNVGGRKLSKS